MQLDNRQLCVKLEYIQKVFINSLLLYSVKKGQISMELLVLVIIVMLLGLGVILNLRSSLPIEESVKSVQLGNAEMIKAGASVGFLSIHQSTLWPNGTLLLQVRNNRPDPISIVNLRLCDASNATTSLDQNCQIPSAPVAGNCPAEDIVVESGAYGIVICEDVTAGSEMTSLKGVSSGKQKIIKFSIIYSLNGINNMSPESRLAVEVV